MSKPNVTVAARITQDLANKVKECTRKGQYISPSEFIRDAIREKVKTLEED